MKANTFIAGSTYFNERFAVLSENDEVEPVEDERDGVAEGVFGSERSRAGVAASCGGCRIAGPKTMPRL